MGAILLVVAAIIMVAVPKLISNQVIANEDAAVAFLRRVARAQDRFFESTGERDFAFIGELLGVGERRSLYAALRPTLDAPMGQWENGVLTIGGYHFVVYLADERGRPLARPENLTAGTNRPFWVAYAWPATYGNTGRKVYAVDRNGNVWAYQNATEPFSGAVAAPPASLLAARIPKKEYPFTAPGKALLQLHWEPVPGP